MDYIDKLVTKTTREKMVENITACTESYNSNIYVMDVEFQRIKYKTWLHEKIYVETNGYIVNNRNSKFEHIHALIEGDLIEFVKCISGNKKVDLNTIISSIFLYRIDKYNILISFRYNEISGKTMDFKKSIKGFSVDVLIPRKLTDKIQNYFSRIVDLSYIKEYIKHEVKLPGIRCPIKPETIYASYDSIRINDIDIWYTNIEQKLSLLLGMSRDIMCFLQMVDNIYEKCNGR